MIYFHVTLPPNTGNLHGGFSQYLLTPCEKKDFCTQGHVTMFNVEELIKLEQMLGFYNSRTINTPPLSPTSHHEGMIKNKKKKKNKKNKNGDK